MDPESAAFQPRDEFWRFQDDMLRVQQTNAELVDRVSRLERRQEEDSRLKNVWGTPSPFPSVLGGTPQQVPLQQPPADHFSNFDDQTSNLIGNLQLDAEDEPRRIGSTSRANSVRFDETANHGHWAHSSRQSLDLISRTGSGLGGHSMSERSYSHKSDGRQSSAGHSVHSATSGRANSLTGYGLNAPVERPAVAPGFFFLGPVPAIIRCWLDTNFKHDTLLYAAVCSGSCESFLDRHLIERLGFEDCITADDGGHKIKMTVYLPEAVPTRSTSPAPQLPSLCVEFNVVDRGTEASDSKTIQIILGSDVLRAHNADILFSTNNLTLYDDEGTKLQIPLVRPEDEGSFKYLVTHRVNSTAGRHSSTFMKDSTRVSESVTEDTDAKDGINGGSVGTVRKSNGTADMSPATQATGEDGKAGPNSSSASLSVIGSGRREEMGTESPASGTGPGPRTGTSPAIWSNWRRDTERPGNLDWASGNKDGNSYQRRDGGIKVLKPTKTLSRSLSSGAPQGSSGAWGGQSRFFDDGKRRVDNAANGNNGAGEAQLKRAVSGEKGKEGPTTSTPLVKTPKAANPVGGASAFAWLKGGDIK